MNRKILERDGHAAEALIAVLLCMGVIIPHSMGLGGGSLLTIYDKNKGPLMIDAREMAPSKANEYMFDGRPDLSSKGVLSIAVPGEIHGRNYINQCLQKQTNSETRASISLRKSTVSVQYSVE